MGPPAPWPAGWRLRSPVGAATHWFRKVLLEDINSKCNSRLLSEYSRLKLTALQAHLSSSYVFGSTNIIQHKRKHSTIGSFSFFCLVFIFGDGFCVKGRRFSGIFLRCISRTFSYVWVSGFNFYPLHLIWSSGSSAAAAAEGSSFEERLTLSSFSNNVPQLYLRDFQGCSGHFDSNLNVINNIIKTDWHSAHRHGLMGQESSQYGVVFHIIAYKDDESGAKC